MPSIDRSFVRHWRRATVAGIVLSVVALAGCSPSGASTGPAGAASPPANATSQAAASTPLATGPAASSTVTPLSFSYHALGKQEYIDQTLSIHNDGRTSVVPTLAITAVDNTGKDLPDVRVTTAYGSDRGSLVVQPRGGYDVLAFSGADASQVADVKVTVKELVPSDFPADVSDVKAQPADAAGQPMSKFDAFDQVILKNPNNTAVPVRIVYLVYDQPKPGLSQQATEVVPIGGLTTVPAGGTASVTVSGDAKAAVEKFSGGPAVSVKAYFSR
ncbi:hypothetical protein ABZ128_13650 [Streptomyces sp. NPDC006326]|uniref:hypothetical protein n=1 Tax=Streptomyces sp. NPDC006326 TaxID=3156752 RepID=UPI0033ACC012